MLARTIYLSCTCSFGVPLLKGCCHVASVLSLTKLPSLRHWCTTASSLCVSCGQVRDAIHFGAYIEHKHSKTGEEALPVAYLTKNVPIIDMLRCVTHPDYGCKHLITVTSTLSPSRAYMAPVPSTTVIVLPVWL
jgi:hypothetical protein